MRAFRETKQYLAKEAERDEALLLEMKPHMEKAEYEKRVAVHRILKNQMKIVVYAIQLAFMEAEPLVAEMIELKYIKKPYLSLSEVAEILSIPERTAYRLRDKFISEVYRNFVDFGLRR